MKNLLLAILIIAAQTTQAQWQLQAVVDQQISCYGNNDGYIHAYVWYGSNVQFELKGRGYTATNTDGHFRGLKTGTYTVTATDAAGTTQTKVLKIDRAYKLKGKFVTIERPTKGNSDGVLQIDISGGTANLQPYLVQWWKDGVHLNNHPDQNWQTVMDNLSAGKYDVIIEDDNGCFWRGSRTLRNKK